MKSKKKIKVDFNSQDMTVHHAASDGTGIIVEAIKYVKLVKLNDENVLSVATDGHILAAREHEGEISTDEPVFIPANIFSGNAVRYGSERIESDGERWISEKRGNVGVLLDDEQKERFPNAEREEVIPETASGGIAIGINVELLHDLSKALGENRLFLYFRGAHKPILVLSGEDIGNEKPDRYGVIMHMDMGKDEDFEKSWSARTRIPK